jgi:chaperone required for assembly of F1-ATPase
MRDIFDEIYENQPQDPMEAARRSLRAGLRKRFYETASVDPHTDGFAVLLDGRPVRTPARRTLAAPAHAIAEAIASEWQGQEGLIDPARMPITRLANSVLDGVADAPAKVTAEVERYLGSDLLFYRAEGPDGLLAMQAQHWDSLLDWARDDLGARFVLAQGVGFVPQPPQAIAAALAAVPDEPWRLGALHSVMTLTGSPLIGLALMRGRIDVDAAWSAAHVDEDWNMSQWGRDELALQRRRFRFAEMQAAGTVLDALR